MLMNRAGIHLVFVSMLILVSCSPYQKVSLSNFRNYEVSSTELRNISFILKKQKLHYSITDRRYTINNYNVTDAEAYESHHIHVIDNIVIPVGAQGVCIRKDNKHFVVDFGEGVQVPFIVTDDNNRPNDKLVIGKRVYSLDPGHQKSKLYFNPKFERHLKSTPGK